MRKDFDKVLVERPRYGHKNKYGHTRRRVNSSRREDDLPVQEGLSKTIKSRARTGKELSENLNPLYRFLNGQVGKPWNDIYSEVRKMIGKNPNAVKGHILQHLIEDGIGGGGVKVNTFAMNNKRYHNVGGWTYEGIWPNGKRVLINVELRNNELYVDEQGILRRYKCFEETKKTRKQRWEEEAMRNARYLPDGTHARKINGVWYKVTLFPIKGKDIFTRVQTYPDGSQTKSEYVNVNDIFGIHGKPQNFIDAYGSSLYAAAKMAMNSNELKKYGLQND